MAVFPNPHHGPIARVDDSTQEGLRVHQHAACGVGVLAHLDGHASHGLIEDGFECLENLDHRGARGAEENTGDGAGMLLQKPHAFLSTLVPGLGDPDDYGVAQVFMPRDGDHRAAIRTLIARRCQAEGFDLIGWRQVPTQNEGLGQTALNSEPQTWQCFVRPKQALEPKALDVRLYVLRRAIENEVLYRNLVGAGQQTFYICSLSRTTVVYKGLLTCGQFRCYFPDLSDTRVTSSLVLVHARFSTNTLGAWDLAHPYRYLVHNGEINTVPSSRRGNDARAGGAASVAARRDGGDLASQIIRNAFWHPGHQCGDDLGRDHVRGGQVRGAAVAAAIPTRGTWLRVGGCQGKTTA
ncbi:MAG: hypothetical protein ACQETW_02685 [Pseudomonadota bacterium]